MLELTAHEQQFHTVPADRWQELFSKFKMGKESALAHVLEVSSAFLCISRTALPTAPQQCGIICHIWGHSSQCSRPRGAPAHQTALCAVPA